MSVQSLLNTTCDIYSNTYFVNQYGASTPLMELKYSTLKCRKYQDDKVEYGRGLQYTENTNSRFYFADKNLSIVETDVIFCDDTRYDVVYVNNLYKKSDHIEVDCYYDDNIEVDEEGYFIWEQKYKTKEILALCENDIMWSKE